MPELSFKLCFVIPVYNHGEFIAATVASLKSFGLPCILVDDGSEGSCAKVLKSLAEADSSVELLTLAVNGGKGAAVSAGLLQAAALGYSHALQIDADGQHNTADIPTLIQAAKDNPSALISGKPFYDASIPKARFYGRYLTHVWVWIETLSLDIKDSMCGFRVYPLKQTVDLLNNYKLGQRMDFDIEIMVRLYWQGLKIISVPTKVIYHDNGVSHFHTLKDNVRISRMHVLLVFGMLRRLPQLLKRNWQKTNE